MPIGWEENLDEWGGLYGDPRRCPRHPGVKTSSDDGLFDAPCYACEGEQDEAYEAERWAALSEEERHACEAQVAAYSAARTEKWANEDDVGF